jgi:hypothetical protein
MGTVKFHYAEDEEFGSMGWIPLKQPAFNASEGLGVAHDTMEHFTLDGSMEDEIMAFGSIFYIRVETGYLLQNNFSGYSPGKILARDISGFFRNVWCGGQACVLKPYVGRPRHLDTCLEHDLDELCRETLLLMRAELEDEGDDAWRTFRADNLDLTQRLKHWIRAGYWKCKARYRGASCFELADAFDTIVREVKSIKGLEEGERLHCTVRLTKVRQNDFRPVVTVRRLGYEEY